MTRFKRRTSSIATPEEIAEFEASLKRPHSQAARGSLLVPAAPGTPPARPTVIKRAAVSKRPHNGIDRSTRQKLRRGRIAPTRTLDLHGFRVSEAWVAVRAFVLDAQAGGHRCVRVVTGRKLGEAGPTGALREALPEIVRSPALRGVVLGCEPAPTRHGGDGAFHLLIRIRPTR